MQGDEAGLAACGFGPFIAAGPLRYDLTDEVRHPRGRLLVVPRERWMSGSVPVYRVRLRSGGQVAVDNLRCRIGVADALLKTLKPNGFGSHEPMI